VSVTGVVPLPEGPSLSPHVASDSQALLHCTDVKPALLPASTSLDAMPMG
jgi:hypothetical protein